MSSTEGSTAHHQSTMGGIVDPTTGQAPAVLPPSSQAPPTRVDEVPQQASTQPGDGSEVHTGHHTGSAEDAEAHAAQVPAEKPSFKDQVLGYAKVTRGTALGNAETKETGKQILEGDPSVLKFPAERK